MTDIDREAVDTVKSLAARHGARIAEVVEQAIWFFDEQLGNTIEVPEGWRVPRDWK